MHLKSTVGHQLTYITWVLSRNCGVYKASIMTNKSNTIADHPIAPRGKANKKVSEYDREIPQSQTADLAKIYYAQ